LGFERAEGLTCARRPAEGEAGATLEHLQAGLAHTKPSCAAAINAMVEVLPEVRAELRRAA
jgi:hypothetical protein